MTEKNPILIHVRNAYVWRIYVSFRIAVFVWHSQFVKAIVMIDFHIIQKDPFIINNFFVLHD